MGKEQETEAERVNRLVEEELKRRAAQTAELRLSCLDCGTDLIRDRHEYVCPQDGHRFVTQGGELIVAPRSLSGPGPDGVPDRRRYPSHELGMARRTAVGQIGNNPRSYDPADEEAKRAEKEQRQRAAQRAA